MPDHSYQNYAGSTHLVEVAPIIGVTITGSCFSQERPDTQVFAAGSRDNTFIDCNLDNVLLPPNSTVIRGCARRFMVQADGTDWIVDAQNNPVEPI